MLLLTTSWILSYKTAVPHFTNNLFQRVKMILNLDYTEVTLSEGVTVEVKPMSVGDYQHVLKFLMQVSALEKSGKDATEVAIESLSNENASQLCQSLLPAYAKNLKGIEINENGSKREAVCEDLLKYGGLSVLLIPFITQLFNVSGVKDGEELKK